jgi:hypothetical protein
MLTVDESQISHQILTLLRCLRREDDRVDWPSGEADWQPFAKTCEYHQVTSFVFCHLNDPTNAVPVGLLDYLRTRYFEISARNYRLAKEAVDLTLLLQERDIPVVAFKGPVVAMAAYGDLALRQYQDIDLVIRRVDLHEAVALLADRGYRIAPESCTPDNPRRVSRTHEVTLAAPDKSYFVDLHWRLASELEGAFCPDVELMRDRLETVHLPQGKVFTFCREDLFVALCCHGTKHRWGRLKWLLDVAEILRSPTSLDWDRVETITLDRPLARASISLAILLAHDLLNAPMPAPLPTALAVTERTLSVASEISTEIFTLGHSTGLHHHHATLPHLAGSIPAWINYLWVRYPKWFFAHAVVRIDPKDRAFVSLPQQLGFLYHVVRPIRLVGKHSTRLARLALSSRH